MCVATRAPTPALARCVAQAESSTALGLGQKTCFAGGQRVRYRCKLNSEGRRVAIDVMGI